MKVILDFPNLRDSPETSKHLQAMAEMAKVAEGFFFAVDKGERIGIQVYMLTDATLTDIVMKLEDENPKIKMYKMMIEMSRR